MSKTATATLGSATRRSARHAVARTVSYREPTASDTEGSEHLPSLSPAKRKRGAPALDEDDEYGVNILRGAAPVSSESELSSDVSVAGSDEPAPRAKAKKRKSPKKKKARTEKNGEAAVAAAEDAADGTDESPKKKRAPRKKATGEEGASPVKKARKPRGPQPEPVYVIPDVEKKTTNFKGRLGYACLNTILRSRKPADQAIFCSRTCRIDSIKKNGIEWMKELGRQNVKDLIKLIEWNEANNIRFMRMSSEMFPFASHPKYGYSLEYAEAELKAVGELANRLGHRLTTHPGQFTQLGSPRKEVVENAFRDLKYHCEMMDRMGLGKDSVMIIHGGGVYGDKPGSLDRIRESFKKLPKNVADRLVLENDEMCYSAEDLLPLCEELQIPLVFDYHHDSILPSSIPPREIIARANAIFAQRGIRPKQHLSEPRPGAVTVMERRAHADRCQSLPEDLPEDVDLMIEAKDKEQAVLHLYRIYDLQPVNQASLRPPAEVESLQTKGRKSHKPPGGTGRKKAVREGTVEKDEEVKGEDPVVPVEEDVKMEDESEASGKAIDEVEGGENEVKEEDNPEPERRKSGRKTKPRATAAKDSHDKVDNAEEKPKTRKGRGKGKKTMAHDE